MNDTAEGLISFLSAHETLGDAGRLMGHGELTWRSFVWTAHCVLGTECTVSQIHLEISTLSVERLETSNQLMDQLMRASVGPCLILGRYNTVINNLHFLSLTQMCITSSGENRSYF